MSDERRIYNQAYASGYNAVRKCGTYNEQPRIPHYEVLSRMTNECILKIIDASIS